MKKVLLLISIISLFSCKYTMQKMYGIKKPKKETNETILLYANKTGIDTSRILFLDFIYFNNNKLGFSIPEGFIFDNKGNRVEYKLNDSACNSGLFSFIPYLKKNALDLKYIKENSFDEYHKKFMPYSASLPMPGDSTYDYYLFIEWSKWTGRLNKDHVLVWDKLASQNKNARIKTYFLNYDFNEQFPDSLFEKMKFSAN